MSEKVIITLHCPCEKSHIFQQPFHVEGLGMTEVQVACPRCQKLLSYEIPWEVNPDETLFRGDSDSWLPPEKPA